ncbi:MAG TPA: hypothetical protein VK357_07205 [Rubrobacteraceae bacterium]|nr:hypothetical protein [Rubrobacteraceae bacterium]
MSDLKDGDRALVVVYCVYDTIVADTDAPTITPLESATSRRAGIISEGSESGLYAVLRPGREPGYRFWALRSTSTE